MNPDTARIFRAFNAINARYLSEHPELTARTVSRRDFRPAQDDLPLPGGEPEPFPDNTLVAPCESKASLVAQADCIRVPAHE